MGMRQMNGRTDGQNDRQTDGSQNCLMPHTLSMAGSTINLYDAIKSNNESKYVSRNLGKIFTCNEVRNTVHKLLHK